MTSYEVQRLGMSNAEDRRWLANTHGVFGNNNPSVTLDISLFEAAEKIKNGIIPSGTAIAKVTETGLWGPYDGSASDGRADSPALLFGSLPTKNMTGGALTRVGGARVDHGRVNLGLLPFPLEDGDLAKFPHIIFEK